MTEDLTIGAHLLGRIHRPDDRDWSLDQLREHLAQFTGAETLSDLIAQGVKWPDILALWRWIKPQEGNQPAPAPGPAPQPAPGGEPWADAIVLNQGNTGHCVGFGWAGFGDAVPVADDYQNADGHAIYYEAKVIDGEPKQENGSTVRSGAKAMLNRSRIAGYAFAKNMSDLNAMLASGTVVFGTDWTNDMFNPDGAGLIKPTGGVAGGHCYLCLGQSGDLYEFRNSWGTSWSLKGNFYMAAADVDSLVFGGTGEACYAAELPR